MFPAKFALLQWDAYPAPVFLLFKGFRPILIPYLESVGQGGSEYGIRIHFTALYRQWRRGNGRKRGHFWVILANRLSAAVEWSDRDGINCIRERNVPSTTY